MLQALRPPAVLLLLTLAGCATPNIDAKHDVRGATTTGVVSGSITYDGSYGAYRLNLVSQTSGETFVVEHGAGQTLNPSLAFGEKPNPGLKKKGSPFAVALPVGSYELKSWNVVIGYSRLTSTSPTGVVFKVEPGEAIYLGNFHFREPGRRVMGLVATTTVALSDQSSRDLAVIRDAFPALADTPITQTVNPDARIEKLGGDTVWKADVPIFIPVPRR